MRAVVGTISGPTPPELSSLKDKACHETSSLSPEAGCHQLCTRTHVVALCRLALLCTASSVLNFDTISMHLLTQRTDLGLSYSSLRLIVSLQGNQNRYFSYLRSIREASTCGASKWRALQMAMAPSQQRSTRRSNWQLFMQL